MNLFDKDKFAKLLSKTKGDMSINEYARACDVSSAHISRLLRGMVDSPPSPETIGKFVQGLSNGVTYNDFMKACGHLGIQDDLLSDKLSKQDVLNVVKEYVYDNSNSWYDKELLLKEITELIWDIKFK